MARWNWVIAGALCILCGVPGCNPFRHAKQPDSHRAIQALPDVPIAPGAHDVLHELCDGEKEAHRISYAGEGKGSYALFYERACDAQGWHCAWTSGQHVPWCALFEKPEALLIVEQRGRTITLYYSPHAATQAENLYSSSSK